MNKRRRSVYLDEKQWQALVELAKAEDRSVNGVVRQAVAAYIYEHGVVEGLSGTTRKSLRLMAAAFGAPVEKEKP